MQGITAVRMLLPLFFGIRLRLGYKYLRLIVPLQYSRKHNKFDCKVGRGAVIVFSPFGQHFYNLPAVFLRAVGAQVAALRQNFNSVRFFKSCAYRKQARLFALPVNSRQIFKGKIVFKTVAKLLVKMPVIIP